MINWKQIQQLEEDIGAEDFCDVVDLFLAEVDEAVDQLESIPANDQAALAPALHFLKGSAYNLGFKAFGDLCSDGEKQSAEGRFDAAELPRFPSLYDDSKRAFLAEAAKHCSYVPG